MFDFLKKLLGDEQAENSETMSLELACASLLIEVSKSDYKQEPAEVEKIHHLLIQHFHLSDDDIDNFMARAHRQNQDSTSLYPFTRYINDNCNNEEKFRLVKALWEVAAEDGEIDKYEEHLIRKIADLIYLPHRDFIRAKLQVCSSLDSDQSQ
ncbi:TerB family tellurite resistance protein [Spongiibacter sp.]|uniref:tellurite resistance TerB family protein n=1 Tax=Spongiibacter sp. TaxID=2024860 RepID=UPI00356591DE